MKIHWILMLGMGGISLNIWASNPEIPDETMLITAHRFAEPIATVLAPVAVVNRAQIERWQFPSLLDILQQLPSITITRNGGLGQLASVSVRGTSGSHVLLLMDGIRLPSTGVTGAFDFSQIPVGLIQRIEYIRGPLAATYGSDAIGGVINVITESQDIRGNVSVSYGSKHYQHYTMAKRIKIADKTRLAFAADVQRTAGYDVHPVANEPDQDGFKSQSIWIGLYHQFDTAFSGFIRGFGFRNTTDYDGSPFAPENQRYLSIVNYEGGLRFSGNHYASQWTASVRNYQDINYREEEGRHSGTPLHVHLISSQWNHHYHFENNIQLNGGVDYYLEQVTRNAMFEDAQLSRANSAIYLTAQKALNAITVETAVRGDNNEQYGFHGTWQAAFSWVFWDAYRMTISHGTAFKAPTFSQILPIPAWGIVANPTLKPEKSRQNAVNFEGYHDQFHWQWSLYYNTMRNLITYRNDRYENEDSVTIKGTEFSLDFMTGDFQHTLFVEYLDAKTGLGETLARQPHTQVKYQIELDMPEWQWDLSYRYLGKRKDSNFDVFPTQPVVLRAIHVLDIGASYKILPKLWIRGKIMNIFNTYYETVFSYPSPGRELSFSLSYDF